MKKIYDGNHKALIVCTTDSMIWNFLVPHIKWLKQRGFTVECACSRTGFYYDELIEKEQLVLHEVPFARSPFKLTNIEAFNELSNVIKEGKFDFIYCHEPVGGALARLAGKKNKKYVMYIAHGFHFFTGAPLKHWILYYTFEYILAFFTNSIITICNEDYKHSLSLKTKSHYLIPGIGVNLSKFDLDSFEDIRKKYRERLNISDDECVFVCVGELSKRKNHRVAINALHILNNQKAKLVICGEGEKKDELQGLVKKLALEKQVLFLGFRKDIPQILSACDCCVFPSLWEGLGLAGIEAMYMGLPVLGSNRQGIKDYVVDNTTGFLFEPSESQKLAVLMGKIVSSEKLRITLGENGKKMAKKYSLENSVNSLETIYKLEGIIK